MDEVDLDVVPLDICGIVLCNSYLYDRKSIFYREENMYHLFKDGAKFIVRAHRMKTNLSVFFVGYIIRIVNDSKKFILIIVKPK